MVVLIRGLFSKRGFGGSTGSHGFSEMEFTVLKGGLFSKCHLVVLVVFVVPAWLSGYLIRQTALIALFWGTKKT